ncbi:MAG: PDDEXK nuclease domain-containing protein, partial [bacterium]
NFILELGKGFSFVERQKRISFSEQHFYIDLVFYNRFMNCFVLFDIKIGKLKHQDLGQLQMYVNYYDREIKTKKENKTIGILLCADKENSVVEMTLPQNNRQLFASKYKLYLPSKSQLVKQIQEFTK